MTTCLQHEAPERMCHRCGWRYCDGSLHGHTPQKCADLLSERLSLAYAHYQDALRITEQALDEDAEAIVK